MGEKKPVTITINDQEYTEDQLTDEQKMLINHVADLDRKIGSTRFNLDQLQVGRDAFVNMLTASLAQGEAE
jgi:cell division protein ZapA (FtsZ GTPase activity inhibitor)